MRLAVVGALHVPLDGPLEDAQLGLNHLQGLGGLGTVGLGSIVQGAAPLTLPDQLLLLLLQMGEHGPIGLLHSRLLTRIHSDVPNSLHILIILGGEISDLRHDTVIVVVLLSSSLGSLLDHPLLGHQRRLLGNLATGLGQRAHRLQVPGSLRLVALGQLAQMVGSGGDWGLDLHLIHLEERGGTLPNSLEEHARRIRGGRLQHSTGGLDLLDDVRVDTSGHRARRSPAHRLVRGADILSSLQQGHQVLLLSGKASLGATLLGSLHLQVAGLQREVLGVPLRIGHESIVGLPSLFHLLGCGRAAILQALEDLGESGLQLLPALGTIVL
mmetsp:Transcript_35268/g.77184  ORF Transcript_35268/g.77184 Transcript_35268/m.77184 type:complete len:327 (-) Transcript_35268:682-1662(-)